MENQSSVEQRLQIAHDILVFIRQHPLRKTADNDLTDAEVLMLAQIAIVGVRNSLAMLGVDA